MKIIYITDARLPTEKAHGLQIMKTCEALVRAGHDVELIAPIRRNHLSDDPFDYYKITTRFPIRKLSSIDLVRSTSILSVRVRFSIKSGASRILSPSTS